MRLFAAIPVPESAGAPLITLLGKLRRSGWPVRWVRDHALHLTLKFFGEVGPERLGEIERVIRQAAQGTGPLALRLDGVGAFPASSRARVLWVGVEAPPALELLQHRLECGSDAIGFAPEGVPFRPHVTLGRVRQGRRLPPDTLDSLAGRAEPVEFLADRVVLYESSLGSAGPRYEARLTLALELAS